MGDMQEDRAPQPAPTVEYCYRHPTVATGVHCTRCGRPICPDCMIPAPVGFQCPECVAEARREFRKGPGNPIRSGNHTATRVRLGAHRAGIVLDIAEGGPDAKLNSPSGRNHVEIGAREPLLVAGLNQFWRLFTATFLHVGILHIGFNAYALYLFGTIVERDYGTAKFLAIYFVSGFLASTASYAFGPPLAVAVGASGAIFGVFGAFIAWNYRRRHLAMAAQNLRWAMTMIVLNAFLAIGFSAIDWRAHVGGLIAGIAGGYVAEGWGDRPQRRIIAVVGFAALIVLGAGIVVWRTEQLRTSLGL
jgi:membrane associated rhomboid family serine protease